MKVYNGFKELGIGLEKLFGADPVEIVEEEADVKQWWELEVGMGAIIRVHLFRIEYDPNPFSTESRMMMLLQE